MSDMARLAELVAPLSEPEPPGAGPSPGRFLAFAALLLGILLARRPDLVVSPQFYWDDGCVFFSDQLTFGSGAFLRLYSGYVQLLPRLVAWLLGWVPIRWAPHAYTAVALAIQTLGCAWFFRGEFRRVVASDGLRALACVLVACSPLADDMLGAVAYAQWYVVWLALLWVVSPLPASRAGRITLATCATAAAVMLPGCIACAPVWAVRGFLARERGERATALLAASGSVAQLALLAAFLEPGKGSVPISAATVLHGTTSLLVWRVAAGPLIGTRDPLDLQNQFGLAAPLLAAVSLAAACALALRHGDRRSRPPTMAGLVALACFLVIDFGGRPELIINAAAIEGWHSEERYFFVPVAAVVVAHVVACARAPRPWRLLPLPALLLAATTAALSFSLPPRRDHGWPRESARLEGMIARGESGLIEIPLQGPPMRVRLDRGKPVPLDAR
jgi:hypothetical protein